MEEKDQRVLRGISRAIEIISRICKVLLIIGGVCLIVVMAALPILFKKIDVKENEIVFNNQVFVKISDDKSNIDVIIDDNIVATESDAAEVAKIIDVFNNNSSSHILKIAESEMAIALVSLIIMIVILHNLIKLFKNICNNETPFIRDNVNYLRNIACLLLLSIIVTNLLGIILELMFDIDVHSFTIGGNVIEILVVISLMYIFKYGCILQEKSKKTIYEE